MVEPSSRWPVSSTADRKRGLLSRPDDPRLESTKREAGVSRFALLLVIASFLMAAAAAAISVARLVQKSSQARPQVPLTAERLDFGEAWEHSGFKWTFSVTNHGPRVLHIQHIEGNCDCTVIEPQEFHLQPGEARSLNVTIDLNRDDWEEGQSVRSFETVLRPYVARHPGGGGARATLGRFAAVFGEIRLQYRRPSLISGIACSSVNPCRAAKQLCHYPTQGNSWGFTPFPSHLTLR